MGNLYITRRSLQNTADAAALVGAQNRDGDTLNLVGSAAVRDARDYAARNGVYTNSGVANGLWHPSPENGVLVNWPPSSGNHAGDRGYLEVRCARSVTSFFAAVFGAGPVRLEARAVARGRGRFAEAAIIALRDDPQAIKIGGSSNTVVQGSVYSRGSIFANCRRNGRDRLDLRPRYRRPGWAQRQSADTCLRGRAGPLRPQLAHPTGRFHWTGHALALRQRRRRRAWLAAHLPRHL